MVTIISKSVKLAWSNEWDSCLSKKTDRMNGNSDNNKYISYIPIWYSHLSFHTFAVFAFPQHLCYHEGPKINKFVRIESRGK